MATLTVPDVEKAQTHIQLTELSSANTSEVALAANRASRVPELRKWPAQPQPIENEKPVEIILTLYDICLILVPVLLMVKTSLCIYSWHRDQYMTGGFLDFASQMSYYLVRFNSQLVTLFTIFFILIISTVVRRYALWKAEKGATVAELEQYQASISLPSTLKAIWSLRAFTLTSAGLVFLWCWVYAGSQAVQREFGLADSKPWQNNNITLLSPHAVSPFEDGSYADYSPVKKTDMISLYHLYSQRTRTPQDDTDYAKMSSWDIAGYALPLLYEDGWGASGYDWNKPLGKSLSSKASSIGKVIYVQDVEETQWYTPAMIGKFTYNDSYIFVNCSTPVLTNEKAPNGTIASLTMALNMTAVDGTLQSHQPRTLEFWNRLNSTLAAKSTCTLSETFVEYGVECVAAGCEVTKMRRPRDKPYPSYRTIFDNDNFAENFIDKLLLACGVPTDVKDLSTFEQDNGLADAMVDVEQYPESFEESFLQYAPDYSAMIGQALTRYFNTFLDASRRMKYDADFEKDMVANSSITIDPHTNADYVLGTMHGSEYDKHYEITWVWIALDYFSCTILLIAAGLSYWLRVHTLAPDIFGYVSSLTRDNPNFEVAGGSTLAGIDRARKMKSVKVKLADVSSNDGPGRVGLTYLGDGNVNNVRRLEKGRSYI